MLKFRQWLHAELLCDVPIMLRAHCPHMKRIFRHTEMCEVGNYLYHIFACKLFGGTHSQMSPRDKILGVGHTVSSLIGTEELCMQPLPNIYLKSRTKDQLMKISWLMDQVARLLLCIYCVYYYIYYVYYFVTCVKHQFLVIKMHTCYLIIDILQKISK